MYVYMQVRKSILADINLAAMRQTSKSPSLIFRLYAILCSVIHVYIACMNTDMMCQCEMATAMLRNGVY